MSAIRSLARALAVAMVLALAATSMAPARAAAQDAAARDAAIPSPEEHFGHAMGAEGRLADWSELAAYYRLVDGRSDRVMVRELGSSTLGNPFYVIFVSSPDNLARLDELRELNAVLADPRGHTDAEVERAIREGRAVVAQSYALHSTEVAASQAAAELVWELATRTDPEMVRILDETVAILFPSLNPDGTTMVADWVDETRGTEYQGASLPWLYHHYIGHDNNRDAFMQNTAESVWTGQILFREWVPQAFIDHHQMGSYGPRLYVPPYAEPIRPDGDPLVWREMAWWGGHMAYDLEAAGRAGVAGASIYSGWGHFGFHWITPFHNIAGMLTESASASMAWPLYVHPDQLEGRPGRGLPAYEAQVTFPNPWPGGWWTVRDIVEQQKIASISALDLAARNRTTVLRNQYLKASRQTARGQRAEPVHDGPNGPLAAFIIPADQHDTSATIELIEKLLMQGIDVRRAAADFVHEGRVYGAGSWIVTMAQPKRGLIRWLLGRTFYPDNTYTRYRDGSPIRPYDLSGHVLAEFMGVEAVPVATAVDAAGTAVTADFSVEVIERIPYVTSGIEPEVSVEAGAYGYRIDGRQNAAFRAVNRLWDDGVSGIRRVASASAVEATSNNRGRGGSGERGDSLVRAGDFLVPGDADAELLRRVAAAAGVSFEPIDTEPAATVPVERKRTGMYRRYYGGNIDEGWTRLVLERFGFPYDRLEDDRIREGDLIDDYDVIILPEDSPLLMKGPGDGSQLGGYMARAVEGTPPEYRSGFGNEGVAALETFVRDGGTLITFGEAGQLAIEEFDLPVRNIVDGLSSTEYWSPGSTLKVDVDTGHPLGFGMPSRAYALYWGGPVYEVVPTDHNERVHRVITFPRAGEGADQEEILQSGWLIGEEVISEKAAMVAVEHGDGQVILIGFRPQHRGQTWGTFKVVFNGLVGG
ncbi:MAG: M14 family zinc carboxypeptidase [Candidatus Longimicrobiales bacterium M2_2A_002]